MTTINDIGDLVRILREQPEWAEALRGVLLSRELLELPEEFANFVKLTNANFETIYGRLDNIDGRLDTMDGKFDAIDGRFDAIDGRLDNGFGINYEMKVERNIRSYAGQQLGLRNTRVLRGSLSGQNSELEGITEQAVENGVITWEQNDDLWLSDLIFTGRNRTDGSVHYFTAEVSITAGDHDVVRAAERARTFSLIVGQPVTPAVVSANVDEDRAKLATENNVIVMLVPE